VSIIHKEFIRRVLKDESDRLEKNQGLQIKKLLNFITGDLYNNRIYTVTDEGPFGGKLSLQHKNYQRFLDIKKRNGKRYPIHNQFVMGHYSSIASRLMHDMTDDVVTSIREDLKLKING